MKKQIRSYDTVFALILFFGFALSMLMALLIGAGVYQRIRDSGGDNSDVCIRYIMTKVRNYDTVSCFIEIGAVGGHSALLLTETIGGAVYTTAIYYYDGYVRELFAESDHEFGPGDGAEIVEAAGLELTLDGALLHVKCGDAQTYVHLTTRRAAA